MSFTLGSLGIANPIRVMSAASRAAAAHDAAGGAPAPKSVTADTQLAVLAEDIPALNDVIATYNAAIKPRATEGLAESPVDTANIAAFNQLKQAVNATLAAEGVELSADNAAGLIAEESLDNTVLLAQIDSQA